jgi:DNA-binding SARP family transcriptional activator
MSEERLKNLIAADPTNNQLREMLAQALQAQGKQNDLQKLLEGSPMMPRG